MEVAQWKELVAEKRRLENIENSRKMEEMKQSLRQSQLQLESRIRQKEERATKLRRAVEQRKVCDSSLSLISEHLILVTALINLNKSPTTSVAVVAYACWYGLQPPMPLLVLPQELGLRRSF
jgi:hypothetical protein